MAAAKTHGIEAQSELNRSNARCRRAPASFLRLERAAKADDR